ncbi:MAG: hypothetical protein KGD68_12125 [Candidatus Lokiarchaeota archaeon]|nr:hypothetical protein [Candidatus Lokiarchaeota archaeon]
MPRNNSIVGSIIGLIIFLGFGVFFLFGLSPFTFFGIMPFFPMIFVFFIIGIAVAASACSRRSSCCTPKSYSQYQHYSPEVPRSNPYIVKTSSSSTIRPIYIEDAEPERPMPNFCHYCGTRKDKNAIYCHSCGTKLQ